MSSHQEQLLSAVNVPVKERTHAPRIREVDPGLARHRPVPRPRRRRWPGWPSSCSGSARSTRCATAIPSRSPRPPSSLPSSPPGVPPPGRCTRSAPAEMAGADARAHWSRSGAGAPVERVEASRAGALCARTQRGSATSSIWWNTTRTGSPIVIVAGSISLIAPSAAVTRLPAKRIVGSSSSSTTIALYGAYSANAGSSGGCGTMNDHTRPRPDVGSHVHVGRAAVRAHRPRRHAPLAARAARLHEQLTARRAFPEACGRSALRGRAAARPFPS